jgi:hypothetical protein
MMNGSDGERGARTESGCGQTRCKAALVRKPFQRVADAGAVDAAGTDARDNHAEIVTAERVGLRVDDPPDRAENAAEQNHDARAVFVDEPALDRDQPGLEQHEQREGPLDFSARPAEFLLDIGDEERPAVLIVRDHHHREHADDQLRPAIGVADATGRRVHVCGSCHKSSPRGLFCFEDCDRL